MDARTFLDTVRAGQLGPVHVVVGPERFLVERAIRLTRDRVLAGGIPGFNEDVFHGGNLSGAQVAAVANTLPMLAERRFVVVREAEAAKPGELDVLAAYVESPSPTTTLLVTGEKLDGRSRLAKLAKARHLLVEAQPLKPHEARSFAASEARARDKRLSEDAAHALLDAIGSDLAGIDDAIERLALYVGDGGTIDLESVEAVVTRTRVDTIWSLVDGVSARDVRRVLSTAASLLEDREPPLRMVAMISRQLRIVARMREALASGLRGPEAAKAAGAPPFKADELARAAKRFHPAELGRAFRLLAELDEALKSSKRPPELILEEALLRLTTAHA